MLQEHGVINNIEKQDINFYAFSKKACQKRF
jgi:hypothetical protein